MRLALDDFGAVFADVSYLRNVSFDLVKIAWAILLPDHHRARVLGGSPRRAEEAANRPRTVPNWPSRSCLQMSCAPLGSAKPGHDETAAGLVHTGPRGVRPSLRP